MRGQRDRIDERVDALGGAQFADIEEVRRVGIRHDGHEFLGAQAVIDDPRQLRRRPDAAAELLRDITTFEQIDVGAGDQ